MLCAVVTRYQYAVATPVPFPASGCNLITVRLNVTNGANSHCWGLIDFSGCGGYCESYDVSTYTSSHTVQISVLLFFTYFCLQV